MVLAVLPKPGSDMTPEWRTHNVQTAPSAHSPSPSSSSAPMVPAASSSRTSGSRSPPRPRKTDVFKPRFPLDPFAGASATALGEPWFLKVDALLAATAYPRRNVIFVLGAPTLKDLAPLLQSRHLAKSLVILATHNPPDIPHIVLPTVRILHLSAPLALEDAGAVRFVNVLEWAERVARTWRKHGGTGVLELSEALDIDSELTPPNVLRFSGSQSTPTSPGSSSTQLSSESLSSSRSSANIRPHSASSGTLFSRIRQSSQSLPRPDPSQRPFDALINFLPDHVSDKALLKNSILVTTISRPFLVSSGPAPPALRSRTTSSSSASRLRPQSIFGAFSRSSSSVYLPPTPPYQSGESLSLPNVPPPPPAKALLIHLLPEPPANAPAGARRKLVESMESFLVSFAFQALSPMSLGSGETHLERARPYVMQASTFVDAVGCEPGVADWGDWTVADVVLSGTLDAEAGTNAGVGTAARANAPGSAKGKGTEVAGAGSRSKLTRRAWIAAAADLVIMPPADGDASSSSSLSPDGPPTSSRPGLRPDSYFPHQHSQSQSLPRAFERGMRASSAPLLSSDWTPAAGRPHSHPHAHQHSHMSQQQSFSSALSRECSPPPPPPPSKDAVLLSPGSGSLGSGSGSGSDGGLPTPPHSEESECASSDPDRTRSVRSGGSEKSAKKSGGWKFWRRLSHHVPSAIKA